MNVVRISVPAFDLSWYNDQYVLAPGGGGRAKTGVKNQIMIGNYTQEKINIEQGFLTDTEERQIFLNGVSKGTILNKPTISTLADNLCVLYEVVPKSEPINFKLMGEFQADFNEESPCVNASLITKTGLVITGGDDKIIRVWTIFGDEKNQFKKAKSLHELKHHMGPITSLCEHPNKSWVASSARDGSCKIWDFVKGTLVVDIPFLVDGLTGIGSSLSSNTKMLSRGCKFSQDGSLLYSIQSGVKSPTYLVKWEIKSKTSEKAVIEAVPQQVKTIGKVPSTRLAISDTFEHLAVGTSDGKIYIIKTDDFKEVQSFAVHDFPVTGLDFAPSKLAESEELVTMVASCSADYKLAVLKVKKYSLVSRMLVALVLILVIYLLYLYTFQNLLK